MALPSDSYSQAEPGATSKYQSNAVNLVEIGGVGGGFVESNRRIDSRWSYKWV
jgi:hypothetical protein